MKFLFVNQLFLLLFIVGCANPPKQKDTIPMHETFTIHSNILGEDRVINIWIPPNYSTTKDSLPVIYMPDGGIAEDFPHIANTISKLVMENKIASAILVGIQNVERRKDLTGFTEIEKDKEVAPVIGGAEKFRSFIRDELFSAINKKYRTTAEKTILGESLAGLFVMETFFISPDMFDNYIAFDPSLWWNNHYLVRSAKEHLIKFSNAPKKLWFAGSKATDIYVYTRDLAKQLDSNDLANLQWAYSDEPKEKHNTIFRACKEKALQWTLGK